ncbi:probable glycosyltransferase At3g07620 [Vicia villosa]|uniref:probable glycosyltransferase At3g07620 n=1 Tax=Vicia villosa TaxID=3911 RepID=UPI00273B46E5|nr:probable glycosyltransferase At3g07620 [Vicia villosa]
MAYSFLPLRFRHLFIVVIFVATILLFQSYWKTFSILLDVPTFIANNVTILDHEFDSDEGRIFRSESFVVDNHEEEIHSFTPKRLRDENGIQSLEFESKNGLLKTTLSVLNNKSMTGSSTQTSKLAWPTSLTALNSRLIRSFNSSSMKPEWSSRRDRELLSAKLEIGNANAISNSPGLYAPLYRDVSKFSRSYELMERKLKVYIYREGEKPIFHQPKMRGIYASEGWFMKLMEGSKRFIVKDPKKAHLFYLPFSSQMLRANISNNKLMEQYLERYVNLIAGRYRFWNRTGGSDHFLVACHDWASRITMQPMKNCIRSLCNANAAKGFQIGKDTTLPVTYIHSVMNPLRKIAGKPPSERTILAFFAGGMHGYLRPILLKHWENKEPDMKIFGQMARDAEGKRIYMEYMNSSRYCICARGYEVHTPRIVEAIFSECVPVIISDNYVPPFFEVLEWEAFSVFVRESDVPSLRDILLSIPEEKYLALHFGVKKVQQHFLWHKIPVKFDLFHMILHSVWNNRLSQMRLK